MKFNFKTLCAIGVLMFGLADADYKISQAEKLDTTSAKSDVQNLAVQSLEKDDLFENLKELKTDPKNLGVVMARREGRGRRLFSGAFPKSAKLDVVGSLPWSMIEKIPEYFPKLEVLVLDKPDLNGEVEKKVSEYVRRYEDQHKIVEESFIFDNGGSKDGTNAGICRVYDRDEHSVDVKLNDKEAFWEGVCKLFGIDYSGSGISETAGEVKQSTDNISSAVEVEQSTDNISSATDNKKPVERLREYCKNNNLDLKFFQCKPSNAKYNCIITIKDKEYKIDDLACNSEEEAENKIAEYTLNALMKEKEILQSENDYRIGSGYSHFIELNEYCQDKSNNLNLSDLDVNYEEKPEKKYNCIITIKGKEYKIDDLACNRKKEAKDKIAEYILCLLKKEKEILQSENDYRKRQGIQDR